MRASKACLAFVPLLLFAPGCDIEELVSQASRFREDFSYRYPLKPGGAFSLDNFNGSVEVLGWEKEEVQVSGVKYAANERALQELRIQADVGPGAVRIRTVEPSERRGGAGARFLVRVPRQVELEHVVTSNGSIRVEDVKGDARLETSNGAITLRQLEGRVQAKTSNGSIIADQLSGDAVLRTSNGSIRLDRLQGALEASTSNASITARVTKPASNRPITLQTSNGSIDFTLGEINQNEVILTTSNASITARLPASLKARLKAQTSNGSIHSDFEILTRSLSKTFVEGDIGGGGPMIQLTTSNGSIRLLSL